MEVIINKSEDNPFKKSPNNNTAGYSFEQQTTNDLNKYFQIRNQDQQRNAYNQSHLSQQLHQHHQAYPHHILRISNFGKNNNSHDNKSKRHSTNFESYTSAHFDNFHNTDSTPHKASIHKDASNASSLASETTSKPMSKEKILSYSYYTNLNYEKPKNGRESAHTPCSPQEHRESSVTSHLNVSVPAPHIRRGGEKKSVSRPNGLDEQAAPSESEIFQKIMNKLAELPESVRLKNLHMETLKNVNGEKEATTNKKVPPNGEATASKSNNNDSNLNRRTKYKSMFIESTENDKLHNEKKMLYALKNAKINLNTLAGDLIFSNEMPYKSTLVTATANGISKSERSTRPNDEAAPNVFKSGNKNHLVVSTNANESRKKQGMFFKIIWFNPLLIISI